MASAELRRGRSSSQKCTCALDRCFHRCFHWCFLTCSCDAPLSCFLSKFTYLYTMNHELIHPFHVTEITKTRMTVSSENATPKSLKSRYLNSLVQIQIEPTSKFESVLRDTEKFQFLDLVDFGDVAVSVVSVISIPRNLHIHSDAPLSCPLLAHPPAPPKICQKT